MDYMLIRLINFLRLNGRVGNVNGVKNVRPCDVNTSRPYRLDFISFLSMIKEKSGRVGLYRKSLKEQTTITNSGNCF